MRVITRVGDLFAVPLDQRSWGVGVVAGKWKAELYLILFKERFDNVAAIGEVEASRLTPLLASSSLDAKIWHGHWPIVQRDVDTSSLGQPIYKVEEPSGTVAESFDRKSRRVVGSDVASGLNYRKTVAPVRLENALKAYHGLAEWEPIFDELMYERVVRPKDLVA